MSMGPSTLIVRCRWVLHLIPASVCLGLLFFVNGGLAESGATTQSRRMHASTLRLQLLPAIYEFRYQVA
jgi:hypothetical protein